MKQAFLNRDYNQGRLILIYAGWGSGMSLYEHIKMPGWDIMLCWDYSDFCFDSSVISEYHTVYLYAWSLGVVAAAQSLGDVVLSKAVAINGTLNPVSDEYGIPSAIYEGTLNGLNERSLMKFQMRMFDGASEYRRYASLLPSNPDIESLKEQLRMVQSALPIEKRIDWTYAFVGRNDRIFPCENQMNAWSGLSRIIEVDGPHYMDIEEIIKSTIVSQQQVASRFSRSMPTYDENAIAQSKIAQSMARRLSNLDRKEGKRLVEIGCGTGLFTNLYSQILDIEEAVLIDLCATPHIEAAQRTVRIQADAESWFEDLPDAEEFDFILSASTIQWFANIDRFFKNCKNHLADNGILCISTFAPGNLCELDEFRVSPIKYLSVAEIEDILRKYFRDFYVCEDKIELAFDSAYEALTHLKLTGVTASGSKNNISEMKRLIKEFPKGEGGAYVLTYRPIYIFIQNNYLNKII